MSVELKTHCIQAGALTSLYPAVESKPRYNSWKPEEEKRLVTLISEGRHTWAQISMQFECRGEDYVRNHWLKIKSKYPNVHYVNLKHFPSRLDGSTGPHYLRSGW